CLDAASAVIMSLTRHKICIRENNEFQRRRRRLLAPSWGHAPPPSPGGPRRACRSRELHGQQKRITRSRGDDSAYAAHLFRGAGGCTKLQGGGRQYASHPPFRAI